MKKTLLLTALIVLLTTIANAETWVNDYGYWENSNEISAKKDLINTINPEQIYDFNTSANAGGEKIVDGKYYMPIMYNGGYNGTDTDYIYVEDLKGTDGANGTNGVNGVDGTTPVKGVDYNDGKDGEKGQQGAQGLQGKGLEDRVEGIVEVRVLDTRNTTWAVYGGHDFNNDVNIVGAKFTYKLGKSYEEKRLELLEAKINNITNQPSTTETIIKDTNGNIVSMHISNNDNGASFTHSF
jgi:hypothetical protein